VFCIPLFLFLLLLDISIKDLPVVTSTGVHLKFRRIFHVFPLFLPLAQLSGTLCATSCLTDIATPALWLIALVFSALGRIENLAATSRGRDPIAPS
jgi:hypothetical protein